MWTFVIVIMFGLLAAIIGGFCGAIGGLSHRGDPVPPRVGFLIFVLVIGLGIFGKWLIASEIITTGKLVAIFAFTFLPTSVLTLFGFARHGL